ncbi:MAG: hypothetical protein GY822_25570 [Deltaproteobacteria bacterium]|nr:hypothetical protein [Deltaproteobacteria bacterium]
MIHTLGKSDSNKVRGLISLVFFEEHNVPPLGSDHTRKRAREGFIDNVKEEEEEEEEEEDAHRDFTKILGEASFGASTPREYRCTPKVTPPRARPANHRRSLHYTSINQDLDSLLAAP